MKMGPLKHRDFRLLWIGLVLNGTATWVYQVTSGWLLYELTRSPLMLGLGGAFMAAPFIVASVFGGALADRMDRRRLLLLSQGIAAVLALVPGALAAAGVIQVWHIFALNFLVHTVTAFDGPARQALIPSLVPRSDLMTALALTSVIRRGTALFGPTIGGIAISLLGVAGAYFIQALFLVIVVLTTILLHTPPAELESRGRSMARSMLDGFQYVRSNPIIFSILGIESMTMLFAMYAQILPVFARDVLHVGPTGLGILYSSPGVGAVIASATMLAAGDVKKKGRLFMITALAKPLAAVGFALSTWMPLSALMLGLVGFFDVAGGTARHTILQLTTGESMRGRVMSMDMMVHRGLGTLNGVSLGALASLLGAPYALAGGSIMVVIYAAASFFRLPLLRTYTGEGERTAASHPMPAGNRIKTAAEVRLEGG
jgi:MFS family permease